MNGSSRRFIYVGCSSPGWRHLTRTQGNTDVGEHTQTHAPLGKWTEQVLFLLSVVWSFLQAPNTFYLNFHTRFQVKPVVLSIAALSNQCNFTPGWSLGSHSNTVSTWNTCTEAAVNQTWWYSKNSASWYQNWWKSQTLICIQQYL